jgi:hypothetical protein
MHGRIKKLKIGEIVAKIIQFITIILFLFNKKRKKIIVVSLSQRAS